MPRNEILEFLIKLNILQADCSSCPWMKYAIAELGVKEVEGKAENQYNPKVVEYLRTVGYGCMDKNGDKITCSNKESENKFTDSTDWCSGFVNWCMNCAGNERTIKETITKKVSPAGAKSWLVWGSPRPSPRFGTVTVLNRPPEPEHGHVAFYLGEYDDQLVLLGGNQNDEVSVASFEKKRLLGYRWPVKTFGEEMWDQTQKILSWI